MIGSFLIEWGSLGLFWLLALIFCFVGTEAISEYTKKNFSFGLVVFACFYIAVSGLGMPKYFVYDHVTPKLLKGEPVYPAVKNHRLLRGAKYQTYGVFDQKLESFESSEKFFASFNIRPYKTYPSLTSLKSYTNELLLLGFFVLWWFVLNKCHNAFVISRLYITANKTPNLANYQSFLRASEPFKLYLLRKRKKAKRAEREILALHKVFFQKAMDVQASRSKHPQLIHGFLSDMQNIGDKQPSFKVNVKRNIQASETQIKALEKSADYGLHYTFPSETDIAEATENALVSYFNNFTAEEYATTSTTQAHQMVLNISFDFGPPKVQVIERNESVVLALYAKCEFSKTNIEPFNALVNLKPKTVRQGKPEISRTYTAKLLAQDLVNIIVSSTTTDQEKTAHSKKQAQIRLGQLKNKKSNLFDEVYRECKSSIKEELTVEVIQHLVSENRSEIDAFIAEVYDFTSENSDFFVGLATEQALSVFESFVGEE